MIKELINYNADYYSEYDNTDNENLNIYKIIEPELDQIKAKINLMIANCFSLVNQKTTDKDFFMSMQLVMQSETEQIIERIRSKKLTVTNHQSTIVRLND